MTTPAPNGYSRAGFYVSLAMVVFTVVGAIIWVGGLASEIQANRSVLNAQAARIALLESGLRANDLLTADMRISTCQQFAKTETQIGTIETIINMIRVDDLRQRGLTWPKAFNQTYPDTFYEIKIPHEVMPCA